MRLIIHPNPAYPEVSEPTAAWIDFLVELGLEIGGREAVVAISWIDDATIRELNRQWRGIDRSTDVLSFHYGPSAPGLADPAEDPEGEILVSVDTARRQAAGEGHSLAEELSVLVIHGLHHILGFDHEDPDEAQRMAAAETPFRDRLATYFRSADERS